MKIKKSSWHYRLHKKMTGGFAPEYRSICSYFWGTVFMSCIAFVVIPMIAAFAALLALTPFIYFFTGDPGIIPLAIIFGSLEIILLLLFGYRRWSNNRAPKIKEPSLVVEFIKAKKSKICPLIEYVED